MRYVPIDLSRHTDVVPPWALRVHSNRFGAVLGSLYTAFGRLPHWVVDHSDGTINDDGDPSNIPPRIYLPILLCVVVIAVAAFVAVVWFL